MRYVVKLSALMAKGHIDPGDIDGWRTIPAGGGEGGARVPIKRVSGGGGELTWRVHPNFTPENAGKDFAQIKAKTFTTSGEELRKAHEIAAQVAENTKDPKKKAFAERHVKVLAQALRKPSDSESKPGDSGSIPAQSKEKRGIMPERTREPARSGLHETKVAEGKRVAADGSPLPPHIEALKLPPKWVDVRYSADPEADLQAVGKDSKGRAQYVYHERFSAKQAEAKFSRIEEMRTKFDEIRAQNDAARKSNDPKTRDSADCLHVIMHTGIRPGSDSDTGADKQAYGASTLQAQHVHIDEDGVVRLRFVGKKGVDLDIPIKDATSAQILRERKEKAGDTSAKLFPNTSDAALRDQTHSYDGGGFKVKDFRTHHGTSIAYKQVQEMPVPKSKKEYEAAVRAVAKVVSKELGNTPIVALQSYINPAVFAGWRAANEI